MLWPALTVLALLAMIALHLWWRGKFARAQQVARVELEKLQRQQTDYAARIQTQQTTLLDSMAEGLLVLDEGGRIQIANRAFNRLFGLAADIRGRTIIEALRLHELAELGSLLASEQQILGYELRLSPPNERWLQINGAAIIDGAGRRHGTILVFHDLTRLKQLENARKEFVANVSHELRTPLSLIKGYVETLLSGAKDNPEVSIRFLETIDRNSERLRLLIEDLLTISELESGRVKLNLQSVALRPVVEKVFGDLSTRAAAQEIKLLNHAPELKVEADADRLEQVLGNLIDNAIKYGRKSGTVVVGGRAVDGGEVELFVQDDGPGIPAEALERVFERFYRVDKARSRDRGGTGLGLSIVKHLVHSHRGRVWAKSEVGHGATFYFTLRQDSGGLQPVLL
jgi:two-component system phosphate regulon sensor histidine kinase PhoR